ncbi:MAG: PhoH family protein [Bilophila sp.]
MQETGIIEVAPLAFMRGRTLNDAFIILDEAQNTTREQMKMFLTRLGFGSRAAITGDITQIDLPAQGEDGSANRASSMPCMSSKASKALLSGISHRLMWYAILWSGE